MSDGERVERLISDWLERNYPDGPTWYGRPAAEAPPLEIRMIAAFGAIEYNLSNGGWAQFLWTASMSGARSSMSRGRGIF